MKGYKNLYPKICSFQNLYSAFERAKRRKRFKAGVGEFEYNLEKNLFEIKKELESSAYQPSKPKSFILKDPKKRIIFAVDFKDRVIHHALCNIIEPIFEKSFIFDSYACLRNKGTHRAVWRFDKFKKAVTKNNSRKGFVLKADIRKYFDTINHQILLAIIGRKISDKQTMWLIRKIVNSYEGKGELKGRGIPIGNLTSQLFANIYLNELDHFVKEDLKIKYYIRYMDDLVILNSSIDLLLETKKKIDEFLNNELDLKLHPQKSRIFSLERGVDFLGYQSFYYYKLLRRGAVKRIILRLKKLAIQYKAGEIGLNTVYSSVVAWRGYSRHANTYGLQKRILKNMLFLINIEG